MIDKKYCENCEYEIGIFYLVQEQEQEQKR